MPLQDHEIIWRPSALVSDSTPAQNGGRMRFGAAIASGVKNNLLPDVSRAEREAGAVKWRKAFIHVASADDSPLLNARVFIDAPTAGDDFVVLVPGTASDTEDQIAGRAYGVGRLAEPLAADDDVAVVVGEHAAYATLQPFRVGDLVRIADRPATGGAGNEAFVTLTDVSWSGAEVTLAFTPALSTGFGTADTVVSSVIERAEIAAAIGNFVVTSALGTFDGADDGHAVAVARGTPDDAWLLTFTSASAFSVAGLASGAVGSGSIHADFAPLNPATGLPLFRFDMDAWGGTWVAGDTLSFVTAAAALSIWYRREVPAGAGSLDYTAASVAIQGESA
ncbi:MAG: hypothetical protein H3C26_07330 [Rhodocyclaceae bacterium]|nr:hypothetical protein [Rhodocyclaceae bacterium]